MGCICSTSRSQGSPGHSQFDSTRSYRFDSTHERSQPIGADGQSSSSRNLSALASLLNATHTLHHQVDADRTAVGEVLTPLQQAAHQLREEIAERINSGFWDSPPNAFQDRLNTIRRDFNTIIAIDEGQGLHYSGEFPMVSPPSRRYESGQSVISAPGSAPGSP